MQKPLKNNWMVCFDPIEHFLQYNEHGSSQSGLREIVPWKLRSKLFNLNKQFILNTSMFTTRHNKKALRKMFLKNILKYVQNKYDWHVKLTFIFKLVQNITHTLLYCKQVKKMYFLWIVCFTMNHDKKPELGETVSVLKNCNFMKIIFMQIKLINIMMTSSQFPVSLPWRGPIFLSISMHDN